MRRGDWFATQLACAQKRIYIHTAWKRDSQEPFSPISVDPVTR
jgi:hypothetical protein